MLGLTVATLVGTPVMAVFGEMLSWRLMFLVDGLIGALTVGLIALYLPNDRPAPNAGVKRELIAFTRPQVLLTLAMAATGFGGMFSIFSYIAATATQYTGLSIAWVPVILTLFGLGMNAGNLVGSRLADKSLMGTIGGVLGFNVVIMTTLRPRRPMAVGALRDHVPARHGLHRRARPFRSRLMDVAREGQTLAAASMHSAFNIANALGAWLGAG